MRHHTKVLSKILNLKTTKSFSYRISKTFTERIGEIILIDNMLLRLFDFNVTLIQTGNRFFPYVCKKQATNSVLPRRGHNFLEIFETVSEFIHISKDNFFFVCLFIYGCVGSSFLCEGSL